MRSSPRYIALTTVFLGASWALAPGLARGSLILTDQYRYVSAEGEMANYHPEWEERESDSVVAPDFGPFDATAAIQLDNNGAYLSTAMASQTSTIGPTGLSVTGGLSVVTPPTVSADVLLLSAESGGWVEFHLANESLWSLEVSSVAPSGVYVYVSLCSTDMFLCPVIEVEQISTVLTLAPGSYALSIETEALVSYPDRTVQGSYSVLFAEIPEPGTLALFGAGLLGLAARRRGPAPASTGFASVGAISPDSARSTPCALGRHIYRGGNLVTRLLRARLVARVAAAMAAAVLLCLPGAMLSPARASASLIAISQDRSVAVEGELRETNLLAQDSDSASASDFGAFSETAEVDLTSGPVATVQAHASQTSAIGANGFTAVASARVLVQEYDPGPYTITGEGRAVVEFTLSFELLSDGLWEFQSVSTGDDVEIYLEGPQGSIVYTGAYGGSGEEIFEVFALPAGSYQIWAGANVHNFADGEIESGFSLSFAEVPEPGTALLGGLGLLAMAGVRRARRGPALGA